VSTDLNARRVLLTGAGGAFGRAARELLERRGARVAGLDREPGERPPDRSRRT